MITYSFPNTIHFAPGACKEVANILRKQHLGAPLFVTDKGVSVLKFFSEITEHVKTAGFRPSMFSNFLGNPDERDVIAGVEQFRQGRCDSIVTIGGGAALDLAKAVQLMVNHPGSLFDYEDEKPNARPVDRTLPFHIAIPTTAGTGSEVGRAAVISDANTKIKKIIFSPRLLPAVAIIDPELTLGLPAAVTAATGIDALSHSVEAFLSKGFHPMCDGVALEGIRLVSKSLKTCVDYAKKKDLSSAEHLEARGLMLHAALMGAVAFQKGLGVTHSCAHALSAVKDLHHGLAIALMLPNALRYNYDAAPERFERMATAVQAKTTFIEWLEGLNAYIGIPKNLSAVGVSAEDLEHLVSVAMADPCHQCNPKPVSEADFKALFLKAL